MKITNQDTNILEVLNKESKLSVYGISRKIFSKLNSDGIRAKSSSILYRLKGLIKYNLVEEEKENGKTFYSIVEENVIFDYKNPRTKIGGMTIHYEKACAVRINSAWEVITFDKSI